MNGKQKNPSTFRTVVTTAALQWSQSPPSAVALEEAQQLELTNTLWLIMRS